MAALRAPPHPGKVAFHAELLSANATIVSKRPSARVNPRSRGDSRASASDTTTLTYSVGTASVIATQGKAEAARLVHVLLVFGLGVGVGHYPASNL